VCKQLEVKLKCQKSNKINSKAEPEEQQ